MVVDVVIRESVWSWAEVLKGISKRVSRYRAVLDERLGRQQVDGQFHLGGFRTFGESGANRPF
jgi:hypothetical protein